MFFRLIFFFFISHHCASYWSYRIDPLQCTQHWTFSSLHSNADSTMYTALLTLWCAQHCTLYLVHKIALSKVYTALPTLWYTCHYNAYSPVYAAALALQYTQHCTLHCTHSTVYSTGINSTAHYTLFTAVLTLWYKKKTLNYIWYTQHCTQYGVHSTAQNMVYTEL